MSSRITSVLLLCVVTACGSGAAGGATTTIASLPAVAPSKFAVSAKILHDLPDGNPLSPDGTKLLTRNSGDARDSVIIWDTGTGAQLQTLHGHTDDVIAANFSPDGARVVTAGDTRAIIWNVATGAQIAALAVGSHVVSAVFSQDGSKVLTTTDDGHLRVWDVASGAGGLSIASATDGTWSPDGAYIVDVQPTLLQFFDPKSGALVAQVNGGWSSGWSLPYRRDGKRIIVVDRDVHSTAKVYDLSKRPASGSQFAAVASLSYDVDLTSARLSPDGTRAVTVGVDGLVTVWNVATGARTSAASSVRGQRYAEFGPDGTRIISDGPGGAMILDAATGDVVQVLQPRLTNEQFAELSGDGRRALIVDVVPVVYTASA